MTQHSFLRVEYTHTVHTCHTFQGGPGLERLRQPIVLAELVQALQQLGLVNTGLNGGVLADYLSRKQTELLCEK